MEWWVYLLLFLALLLTVVILYLSFLRPNKIRRRKLSQDLKRNPNKIVISPEDVKLFRCFKLSDLKNTKPEPEYFESGVYGFYVDDKINNSNDFYPIYLTYDEENIWKGILHTNQELLNHQKHFQNVFDYLEKNKQDLSKIKFFIIEDYNLENFDYWTEILETDIKGFNFKARK